MITTMTIIMIRSAPPPAAPANMATGEGSAFSLVSPVCAATISKC